MNDTTLAHQDPITVSLRGLASMIMSLTGFSLIWIATDWRVALGLFVILIANNMAHSIRRLDSERY